MRQGSAEERWPRRLGPGPRNGPALLASLTGRDSGAVCRRHPLARRLRHRATHIITEHSAAWIGQQVPMIGD